MSDELKKYLHDLKTAIDRIDIHLQGKRIFSMYHSNITIKKAVERELEIIGEATNRINKLDSSIKITGAKGIISLRNYIMHAYDSVDDNKIWAIVVNDLPLLKTEVQKMLDE